VHDRAAGEVERAHVRQEAAAPHPVCDRHVDEDRPQRDERDVGGKAHALDDGAGDERRRDDAEGALVAHEQQMRDRALRLETDTMEECHRGVAEEVAAFRERERVADHRPQDADEPERDETHHHRVQGVLGAHEAAIEERQGRCHQQHQRCRDQHPTRICCIHRVTLGATRDVVVRLL
jgi:hypothetical protein